MKLFKMPTNFVYNLSVLDEFSIIVVMFYLKVYNGKRF